MNKPKFGIVAVILLLGALLIATPASANIYLYSSGKTTITDQNGDHKALIYNIVYKNGYHPHVGGVNLWLLGVVAPEHKNTNEWTWQKYGTSKSVLLIPYRYTLANPWYGSQIYIEVLDNGGLV